MQDRIKQFRSWEDNAQREIEEFHPVSSACVYAGMKEGEAEASNELASIFDAALIEAKDITQHAVPSEFALRGG